VEPENKATIFGLEIQLSQVNNYKLKSGVSSLILLQEKVHSFYLGLVFDRGNPFFDIIDELILYLMSGGLIQFWRKTRLMHRGMFKIQEKVPPQVLTMGHLEIGFLICLIPMGLSLIAFLIEASVGFYRKKTRNPPPFEFVN
jgi:hypothetical protein